jgi:hypothetical protein
MMNFGTPNMFITLWFELDYGTNPPLGTLMIWQVQLCMCIWKCCIFVGKNGLKGRSHKFKGANEESRSCSTARWNHSQRWQGPRCYIGAFTRSKAYRTSCEKTPYLKRGDDVAKIMQLKGFKSKMMRGPMWKKGRPNRAKVGLGRSAQAIRPTHFLASVRPLISWAWRWCNPKSLWAPPFPENRDIRPRGRPQGREVGEERDHSLEGSIKSKEANW